MMSGRAWPALPEVALGLAPDRHAVGLPPFGHPFKAGRADGGPGPYCSQAGRVPLPPPGGRDPWGRTPRRDYPGRAEVSTFCKPARLGDPSNVGIWLVASLWFGNQPTKFPAIRQLRFRNSGDYIAAIDNGYGLSQRSKGYFGQCLVGGDVYHSRHGSPHLQRTPSIKYRTARCSQSAEAVPPALPEYGGCHQGCPCAREYRLVLSKGKPSPGLAYRTAIGSPNSQPKGLLAKTPG